MGLFDRLRRRAPAPIPRTMPSPPPRAMPAADAFADPNKITQGAGARGFVAGLWQSTSALVNAFNGVGTAQDPSSYNAWALPRPLTRAEHVGMGRNALIAQALGKLPYTATREGWRVVITDERVPAEDDARQECADEIAAYESRLNIGMAIARALFRGRQHSHALVLLGIADGRSFDQPVDWANVKTIRWAVVIDARDFYAYRMYPASSERFGEIEVYQITDINGILEDGLRYGEDAVAYQYSAVEEDLRGLSAGAAFFHADRVLSFHTADYISILDSLQDSLGGYFTSMSGISTAAREASLVVYKISNWIQKAWSEDANLAHAHMTFVDRAKSTLKAWVIDKENEEVSVTNRNMSGIADLSNPSMVWVSAALGIPVTKFWGVSPGGFGKGEAEEASFHQDVRAFQTTALTPQLMHLHALILVAQDGCNLPPDLQRVIHYEDLSPPDEEVRSKLRSEALIDLTKAFETGGITREEYRAGLVHLTDDYFRIELTEEGQHVNKDALVGAITGTIEVLKAASLGEIPAESAQLALARLIPSSFDNEAAAELINPIKARRAAANTSPPVPATDPAAPTPADEEDGGAEPSEIDVAWSQNPLPSDAMEAAAIAAELNVPTVRVTRAHKAGLIEGWTVLGGKPRYSLGEVKRVVLQGNGKLPPSADAASTRDARARAAVDLSSLVVVLRAPKTIAQWVPYKAAEPSAPHVTLLYVGKVSPKQIVPVLDTVRVIAAGTQPLAVDFASAGYFDNDDKRVAYLGVAPSEQLQHLHAQLRHALQGIGVAPAHVDKGYTPHLTLAYLSPGEDYTGPVPIQQGWTAEAVELWCDDFAIELPLGKPVGSSSTNANVRNDPPER